MVNLTFFIPHIKIHTSTTSSLKVKKCVHDCKNKILTKFLFGVRDTVKHTKKLFLWLIQGPKYLGWSNAPPPRATHNNL